jgi:CFEM domain
MFLYNFLSLLTAVQAISSTKASTASSSVDMSTSITTETTTVNNSIVSYSLTALPVASSLPICVFNCLNDAGLRGVGGCDFDLTNDCACLDAAYGADDFLTSCVATVCTETASAGAYEAIATSVYNSYCLSLYGLSSISSASSSGVAAQESSAPSNASSATSPSSTKTGGASTNSHLSM